MKRREKKKEQEDGQIRETNPEFNKSVLYQIVQLGIYDRRALTNAHLTAAS